MKKRWRNGGLTGVLIRSRRWVAPVPIVEKIKGAPTKGVLAHCSRACPAAEIVCAHTLNVLSSWSRAKSAGPAKRTCWLAGSTVRANRPRKIAGVCHWRSPSTNAGLVAVAPATQKQNHRCLPRPSVRYEFFDPTVSTRSLRITHVNFRR